MKKRYNSKKISLAKNLFTFVLISEDILKKQNKFYFQLISFSSSQIDFSKSHYNDKIILSLFLMKLKIPEQ